MALLMAGQMPVVVVSIFPLLPRHRKPILRVCSAHLRRCHYQSPAAFIFHLASSKVLSSSALGSSLPPSWSISHLSRSSSLPSPRGIFGLCLRRCLCQIIPLLETILDIYVYMPIESR